MYSCTKDELEQPVFRGAIENEILQAVKSNDTVQPASTPESEPTTTTAEPIEKEEIKPDDV